MRQVKKIYIDTVYINICVCVCVCIYTRVSTSIYLAHKLNQLVSERLEIIAWVSAGRAA